MRFPATTNLTFKTLSAFFVAAFILSGCAEKKNVEPPPANVLEPVRYVGQQACLDCHQEQSDKFQASHHDKAMEEATAESVRGDFDNTEFAYNGIVTSFSQESGKYFVTTDGPDGALKKYLVEFTFGVEPLQQYLIRFEDGRIQALGIAWDTRAKEQGGQRWFHLYPDEAVDHTDPLHWTKPAQNWNFMCAECHSTNVRKNFDHESNRFETSWSEIDVSCEACHGPASHHVMQMQDSDKDMPAGFVDVFGLSDPQAAAWIMDAERGIAARSMPRQDHTEIETCARCHSRRAMFSEDFEHGKPLLNTHLPALLDEDLYFADGQIKDEVFVYGSFLQSKMYAAGVTCSDCHDAHSLEIKGSGNNVCAQCHSVEVFDTPEHHHHQTGSEGAQCVACHMPERTYMVVDDRADHRFGIPRPDLHSVTGAPDACTGCHTEQNATWAAGQLIEWFDEPADHFATILAAGQRGDNGASQQLIALFNDANQSTIVRATAISLLATNPSAEVPSALNQAVNSREPLIRMGVATAMNGYPLNTRISVIGPLLKDPVAAVRQRAAATLAQLPRARIPDNLQAAFDSAINEYRLANKLHADQSGSLLNLANLSAVEGDLAAAVGYYQSAIDRNPSFVAAYINMADLYRVNGEEDSAETILRRGLKQESDSADLHHVLGLSLVRQQRLEEAISEFTLACKIDPENTRYAYVLGVALHSDNQTDEALGVLKTAHEKRAGDRDVLVALITISRDVGRLEQARDYAETLLALDPSERSAQQLLDSLKR